LRPGALLVSGLEHPCVLRPAEQLARHGWTLHRAPIDATGRVDATAFAELLRERPKLVSVMLANNETGVVQDVEALASAARSAQAWFHTDAVQAVGKLPVDFRRLNAAGVHALTLSGHKLGGPKGAAALILDKRLELESLIAGGGHERGLRSGTENVAAIVGLGVACALAVERQAAYARHVAVLRQRLESGLLGLGATVFGLRRFSAWRRFVCRIPCISRYRNSTAKRWSDSLTGPVTRSPAAQRVRAPIPNRRMSCVPWG